MFIIKKLLLIILHPHTLTNSSFLSTPSSVIHVLIFSYRDIDSKSVPLIAFLWFLVGFSDNSESPPVEA